MVLHRLRRAAPLAVLTTLLAAAAAAPPAHAATPTETLVGVPHHNLAIYGATFGSSPDGDYAYAVARGTTGALSVIDTRTATVIRTMPLPGAGGSWGGTVMPDGTAYLGADSKLFRYRPGAASVDDLGSPVPGETTAWRLANDGRHVFVGTYPGGKVYSFDHRTGEVRDYGQIWPGEQYVRSIAAANGKLYAGLGTVARLVEIDIAAGTRREIPLPEPYRAEQFVYDLDVYQQTLFARLANSNRMLVHDLRTGEWIADLGTSNGLNVSPPDAKKNVYFGSTSGRLMAYNLDTRALTPTGFTGFGTARGYGWTHLDTKEWPGRTLVTINLSGVLYYYNPQTGAHKVAPSGVPGLPAQLQTLVAGPDGRIWSSAYPSGGITAYDPATGTFSENAGALGQAEGLRSYQGKIYAGVYPGANLFELDPAKPVVRGSNPRQFGTLRNDHQDRPFAITGVGARVAFGTIPEYGQLGGALSFVDPATGAQEVHRNVVPDQSVTALTTVGDLVLAGTGVWGGLGTVPTQTEARLFLWDPATATKVWEGPAIPGAKAITALIVAPNGHVWGSTAGTLFEFDPVNRTVLRTLEVQPFDWNVDHVWRSDHLAFAPDGALCGNFRNTVACVDTTTLAVDRLATGIDDVWTMDADGVMYYARGGELYRLTR
ncbi:PQQ-binding-like beta-propeller repeat protein [Micromonospora sp. DR5-3]|uniref:PQQ-binding-like beta-propeller repeat protein n=1 Tax=unclassified Micromonospora TaxID=2617518 RepID=UPI0011D6A3CC|nr:MULTISPECIES: PQQ-binding-like beta-propeller repeat protein [unclassified Micromonospora]MCW3819226.1 PQQ-binding-like beta-propeller repeat protein [Micromonospora sp. DR5-3]TYC20990.1 PQQ-like beta-propeller repeat protein [Micromonospora sp. MP36]